MPPPSGPAVLQIPQYLHGLVAERGKRAGKPENNRDGEHDECRACRLIRQPKERKIHDPGYDEIGSQ